MRYRMKNGKAKYSGYRLSGVYRRLFGRVSGVGVNCQTICAKNVNFQNILTICEKSMNFQTISIWRQETTTNVIFCPVLCCIEQNLNCVCFWKYSDNSPHWRQTEKWSFQKIKLMENKLSENLKSGEDQYLNFNTICSIFRQFIGRGKTRTEVFWKLNKFLEFSDNLKEAGWS